MKFFAIFLFVFAIASTINAVPLNNTKYTVLLQRLRRQTQDSVNQDLCAIFGVCDGQSGGNIANNGQPNRPGGIPTSRPNLPGGIPTSRPNLPGGIPTAQPNRPGGIPTDQPNRPGGIPTSRPNLPGGIPTAASPEVQSTTSATVLDQEVASNEAYGRCITMCQGIANFNPVCGSDGVTYDNLSKLRCAASCGRSNVTQTRLGAC